MPRYAGGKSIATGMRIKIMSNPFVGEHVGAEVAPISDVDFSAVHIHASTDGPRLIGCRCEACGALAFPKRAVCFSCGSRSLSEELLARTGALYSYTVVHVSSSRPTPYTIGYVDLDDGVRLLATVVGDASALRPDLPVELRADDAGFSFSAVETGVAA
jgi:uncharacterized protein